MKGAHVIENGQDYTVIATDDDGDGFYDDVHYVHVIPENSWVDNGQSTVSNERTESSNSSSSSYSGYTGGGSINWKKVGIIFLGGVAFAIISFVAHVINCLFFH